MMLLRRESLTADQLDERWRRHNQAGHDAYERRDYTKAIESWKEALQEAKNFGNRDPRLHLSIMSLALLNHVLGKYEQSDRYLAKSRDIWEGNNGVEELE